MEKKLPARRMIALCEDAFRPYGGGKELKILGCTVKNVRNAVKRGSYDTLFISNATFSGVNHGPLWMGGNATVINCKVDLGCGALLLLFGCSEAEVEITVLPSEFDFLPLHTRDGSGVINGRGNRTKSNI